MTLEALMGYFIKWLKKKGYVIIKRNTDESTSFEEVQGLIREYLKETEVR